MVVEPQTAIKYNAIVSTVYCSKTLSPTEKQIWQKLGHASTKINRRWK